MAVRPEARAFEWSALSRSQREVGLWLLEWLAEFVALPANRDGAVDLGRHDEERTANVVLIEGARGTGKSSLALTLLDAWRGMAGIMSESALPPGAVVPARQMDTEVADRLLPLRARLVPTRKLELHTVPPGGSMVVWMGMAIRQLTEGTQEHGASTDAGPERIASWNPNWDSEPVSKRCWFDLVSAAATGWPGNTEARKGTLDPDAYAEELKYAERARTRLVEAWRALVSATVVELHRAQPDRVKADARLIVTIDDADLNTARLSELLELLPLLWDPQLVFVLVADATLLLKALELSVLRAFRVLAEGAASEKHLPPPDLISLLAGSTWAAYALPANLRRMQDLLHARRPGSIAELVADLWQSEVEYGADSAGERRRLAEMVRSSRGLPMVRFPGRLVPQVSRSLTIDTYEPNLRVSEVRRMVGTWRDEQETHQLGRQLSSVLVLATDITADAAIGAFDPASPAPDGMSYPLVVSRFRVKSRTGVARRRAGTAGPKRVGVLPSRFDTTEGSAPRCPPALAPEEHGAVGDELTGELRARWNGEHDGSKSKARASRPSVRTRATAGAYASPTRRERAGTGPRRGRPSPSRPAPPTHPELRSSDPTSEECARLRYVLALLAKISPSTRTSCPERSRSRRTSSRPSRSRSGTCEAGETSSHV